MKKVIVALLVAVLVMALVPPVALAQQPDKGKPVTATDVELVKKVTLHGKKPHPGGGKPSKYAATGELGEVLGIGANKYAIVVGISDYPGTVNDLDFADDDAIAMATVLSSQYGYGTVTPITNLGATRTAIETAINAVKDAAGSDDEVVFFFSGHGASGVADDGDKERIDEALVTHDGSDLVPIWDGELADWFSGFQTSRIIFIFDTCLAGGMTDLKAKKSQRVINMATTERGLAYEGDWGGGHGQFSYYFVVEGMSDGYANVHDYDSGFTGIPEQVTVEEAYDYAKANCGLGQKPTISDSFGDDLLL